MNLQETMIASARSLMEGLQITEPALALDLAMDLHRLTLEAEKHEREKTVANPVLFGDGFGKFHDMSELARGQADSCIAGEKESNRSAVNRPIGNDGTHRRADTARNIIAGKVGNSVAYLEAENVRLRRQLNEAYDRALAQDASIGILNTQLKEALERAELSDEERKELSWGS